MGAVRDFFFGDKPELPPTQKLVRFSAVGSDLETWNNLVNMYAGSTVTRREALNIPSIKRARDVFAALGSLPMHVRDAGGTKINRKLLDQPEKLAGLTRSVSMANLIDDLFFYGQSLWKVAEGGRDFSTYPTIVDRIPRGRWNVDEGTGRVMVDGDKINPLNAIIFTSPNDPILNAAGPLKALLALEATAAMRIGQPAAMEYFRSTDGRELDDEEVQDFLDDVTSARKANVSGWLPEGIERIPTEAPTPEQLQLSTAREFSILETSRMTGLSANWLNCNTTTRTYNNAQDERNDLIQFAAKPYLTTIEERLSLGDVTPNGQRVQWNYDGFLRSAKTTERYEAHKMALEGGWLTVAEIRELEDLPPMNTESD